MITVATFIFKFRVLITKNNYGCISTVRAGNQKNPFFQRPVSVNHLIAWMYLSAMGKILLLHCKNFKNMNMPFTHNQ